MAWTTPTARTTGELITASIWNTDLKDNLLALLAGLSGTGFTLLDVLGAAAPAASASGHLILIYNTSTASLQASLNGGAYEDLASFLPADAVLMSRWRELSRY